MFDRLRNSVKAALPVRQKLAFLYGRTRLRALLAYPFNRARGFRARVKVPLREALDENLIRRAFTYDHSLVPNTYIAGLESETDGPGLAVKKTGRSIGYPAWNLLYYSLLCSLPADGEPVVVVETGTDLGFSTIILAQALKDRGVEGLVHTVDISGERVEIARRNIREAGVSEYVSLNVADSLPFLRGLTGKEGRINFAFLDGSHEYSHLIKEFSIIYHGVAACGGKVYFDNTVGDTTGVARALYFIRHAYNGNMIEFRNCSWLPPGNVIWQSPW